MEDSKSQGINNELRLIGRSLNHLDKKIELCMGGWDSIISLYTTFLIGRMYHSLKVSLHRLEGLSTFSSDYSSD